MLTELVVAAQTVTLLAGGFVTLIAVRAYRRTGAPALRALAAGLGLVTTGSLVAGAVHQVVNLPLPTAVAVQSTATAAGFVVLAYSLYAEGPSVGEGAIPSVRSE